MKSYLTKDYIDMCARAAAIVALRYGKYTELAETIGVSRQAISQWLSGMVHQPTVEAQEKIREWIKAKEVKIKRFTGIERLKEVQEQERLRIMKKAK